MKNRNEGEIYFQLFSRINIVDLYFQCFTMIDTQFLRYPILIDKQLYNLCLNLKN